MPRAKGRRYRLAILKLDRLGDGVLSLGSVRLLVKEFGADQTLLIISNVAEPLFRNEFPGVDMLVLPPFSQSFWPDFVQTMIWHASWLRAIQADDLVCLRHQPSDYLHAIASLVRARQMHASEWLGAGESVCLAYTRCRRVPYPEYSAEGCLELEAHRRVTQSVLGRSVSFNDIIPVLHSSFATGDETLLVCPQAGAAIRQYPPASLALAIALFLQAVPEMRVVVCLPPGTLRTPYEQSLQNAGVSSVFWVYPANLGELRQAISSARLVLAPDSAPAHLTTAMNKPGVFLLGGGHYGMFAPWRRSTLQVWLNHHTDCYQCQWRCSHAEPFCITHIQPSAVAAALQSVYAAAGVQCVLAAKKQSA
ncbi:ADP-heptose:LPS heptosyltransferase [Prosthecobacter vanneervenii]|uniref:ADP-heptose:LPS heptosyltransferase n=2 Tax=Prosthecobacter vanneervenii TaxID=48466 RepID=A0A7W8DI33_9BACT|nr:ADP-heptose:LPS heptosyltransferase [Prosthecobacter vanneervenii]